MDGLNCPESATIITEAGPLAGLLHLPAAVPAPAVVCCHGMLSSKDSGKFALIAEALCRTGVAVLRFDFSGCGESKAALAESLLSSRMRDVHAVLDHVRRQPWCNGAIGLMGSSLGGYLALLAAASGRHSIAAVACWAAPFDLREIQAALDHRADLDSLFPPGFRLGSPETLEGLQPVNGVLTVHGQQDEVVPWQDAIEIHRRAAEPKRLLLVAAADHRFIDPECRQLALEATLDWFRERGLASQGIK